MTQSGPEPTICRTRGERTNDYTTDTVLRSSNYRHIKANVALAIDEIIGLKFENHNFHRELNGISIC